MQEQRGTIVDFIVQADDQRLYKQTAPGQIFRPRFVPDGIWLQLDGFDRSPMKASRCRGPA